MASRIKEIILKIGGNITGLDKVKKNIVVDYLNISVHHGMINKKLPFW